MRYATIWQACDYRDQAESDSFFRTRREAVAMLDLCEVPKDCRQITKHRVPLNTEGICRALKVIPMR